MNERSLKSPPVSCRDCGFEWYSAALARGLRLLGSCPRCAGRLRFASAHQHDETHDPAPRARAPHLVLGFPRGRTRG